MIVDSWSHLTAARTGREYRFFHPGKRDKAGSDESVDLREIVSLAFGKVKQNAI